MPKKLKPCPFCGGNGFAFREKHGLLWNRAYTWTVTCCDCVAEMRFFPTQELAVEYWNRRVKDGEEKNDKSTN